jgi:phosphonate transport system ATP-binding protein
MQPLALGAVGGGQPFIARSRNRHRVVASPQRGARSLRASARTRRTGVATMSLVLEGLSRRFGQLAALDGIDLEIGASAFTVVVGPSGAGKSTLLRLVNRLVDPTAGRIVADGLDVTSLRGRAARRWRSQAAMIFQHFNLAPRLDALTNVLIGRLLDVPAWRSVLCAFTRAERLEAMRRLDELGLADRAFERAERLSGGQQQRVAIARALMQRPKYILADEPVASLDPRNAEIVMQALHAVNREHGIGIVCNLHHVELACKYADRVVALRAGRIAFDGAPGELTPARTAAIYQGDRDAEATEFRPRLAAAIA